MIKDRRHPDTEVLIPIDFLSKETFTRYPLHDLLTMTLCLSDKDTFYLKKKT